MRRYIAEAFGTAVLVLLGCGSAVIAGNVLGGTLGIAFGFGLAVVAMAYTIGHISGCHINPAITVGMCVAGRMRWETGLMYIIAQVIGAIIGTFLLILIAHGGILPSMELGQNVIRNNFTVMQAFLAELIATFIFVRVVLGVTSHKHLEPIAGLVIGLTLVLIHIVFIPVTGTSVNPARSTGPALFAGWAALNQLWLFWIAPLIGAVLAGVSHNFCNNDARVRDDEFHNEEPLRVPHPNPKKHEK